MYDRGAPNVAAYAAARDVEIAHRDELDREVPQHGIHVAERVPAAADEAGAQPVLVLEAVRDGHDVDRAPGTQMTMGEVTISVGQHNPLHRHDNCEELLYLIEGALEHRIGDETHTMGPSDIIRVPIGVPHQGRNIGATPARMVVAYNHPYRAFEVIEEQRTHRPPSIHSVTTRSSPANARP